MVKDPALRLNRLVVGSRPPPSLPSAVRRLFRFFIYSRMRHSFLLHRVAVTHLPSSSAPSTAPGEPLFASLFGYSQETFAISSAIAWRRVHTSSSSCVKYTERDFQFDAGSAISLDVFTRASQPGGIAVG